MVGERSPGTDRLRGGARRDAGTKGGSRDHRATVAQRRTSRTVDLAIGERVEGPILERRDGQRLDRRTAHRSVGPIGKRAGLGLPFDDVGMVYFEDVEVGHPYFGAELVADEHEMVEYGRRFDPWPMHADPDVGDASPLGGLVASGGYTISLWYLSAHSYLSAPGNEWAFMGGFDWHVQFPKPLRPGERVRTRSVITEKRLSSKPGRGVMNTEADLIDHSDEPVLRITAAYMMATRPTTA